MKRSRLVGAHGVGAARVRRGALVGVDAGDSGISAETWRTPAQIGAVRVGARAAASARVGQSAFVHVSTAVVWIPFVSDRTRASVITGRVLAQGLGAASVRTIAFVDIFAFHFAVALETVFALAAVVSGQVAAFGIVDAFGRQLGHFALVDIGARMAVSFVSRIAGAFVTAQGVGAVSEDVTRSILALVFVWH